ncbi:hypothetical protein AXG93_2415s1080 [Marchantia polymorpha subsp. ruderalis]|uniref:Biogenesis of lysosome-related organelles complex 1 subunit 1 n=1 Tax=Marchantia polymorpha subsp. ruderalis TaxID=1480154 RepID=A0A176VUQ8_MARPO|nr:hypothetical protein AXG93_2415s1080 [Marchantia polymorpha subsp. ruderalis]
MAGALDASFAHMMQQHSIRNVVLANRLGTGCSSSAVRFAGFLFFLYLDHTFRNGSRGAEKSKKEALSAATEVAGLLVDSVNGGVHESFINEKRIEMEARALAATVQRFTQTTTQWLTVFHNFDSALKEIGDFENWIKVMEYDCESVGKALNYITQGKRKEPIK